MTRRRRHRHARALFSIKKRGGGWLKFMNFNSGPCQPEQQAAVMCRMIFNKLPASVATGVREICTAHGNVELSWWNNEESARPPERERAPALTLSRAPAAAQTVGTQTHSHSQLQLGHAGSIKQLRKEKKQGRRRRTNRMKRPCRPAKSEKTLLPLHALALHSGLNKHDCWCNC